MARGKHSASRDRVRQRSAAAQLAHLRDELVRETDLLRIAQQHAQQVDALRTKLNNATQERDTQLRPVVERLRTERDTLQSQYNQRRARAEEIRETWGKLFDKLSAHLGGGVSGAEAAGHAVGAIHGKLVTGVDGNVDTRRAVQLQRARGLRPPKPRDVNEPVPTRPGGQALLGVARPLLDLAGMYADNQLDLIGATTNTEALFNLTDEQADALADRRAAVGQSHPGSLAPDAVATWHPLPLLRWCSADPFQGAPEELGHRGHTEVSRHAHDLLLHRTLDPLTSRDAAITTAARRIVTPWHPLPRFTRPGDAVTLRHLYAQAAYGAWLRASETVIPAHAHAADETTWAAEPPSPTTLRLAQCATALRTSVPFWLPAAQTHSFLDAQLPDGAPTERLDMRLPFEATLLTFAEPLVLPGEQDEPDPRLWYLRGLQEPLALLDFLTETPSALLDDPPTPGDLLRRYGADVEGVLLLGDREGNLRPQFAWCLALRGAGPGAVASRVVMPATFDHLSKPLADLLTNAAAVVAWGSWHDADNDLLVPPAPLPDQLAADRQFRDLEHRGGAGDVRVLDMRRTSSHAPDEPPTGRTVAPHMRRGHWRRQRYGPRATMVKRVWVGPVLVNAGRFVDVAPRVYRLPAPEPAHVPMRASQPSRTA